MREVFRGDRREQHGLRSLDRGATWEQIVAAVEELKQESCRQFRDRHGDWGWDLALWLAWKQGEWTLRELGEKVGRIDYTSVSTAVKHFRDRCQHDRKLASLQRCAQAQLAIGSDPLYSLHQRWQKLCRTKFNKPGEKAATTIVVKEDNRKDDK